MQHVTRRVQTMLVIALIMRMVIADALVAAQVLRNLQTNRIYNICTSDLDRSGNCMHYLYNIYVCVCHLHAAAC